VPDQSYRCLGRLPFTTAPVHDETLDSYIRRLALLNEVSPRRLRDAVADSTGHVTAERLAAASGQPVRSLKYAVLQLCSPAELFAMNIAGRPKPAANQPGKACDQCAAAGGALVPVWRWLLHEDVLCLRHQRWSGRGPAAVGADIDLSGHREIVRAGRMHRQLIHGLGRREVRSAFNHAAQICHAWITSAPRYSRYCTDPYHHLQEFIRRGYPCTPADPAVAAALYPQTVALTELLADPKWWGLATSGTVRETGYAVFVLDSTPGFERFIQEIRERVAANYRWQPFPTYRSYDPLVRHIIDGIQSTANPEWPRFHLSRSTLPDEAFPPADGERL